MIAYLEDSCITYFVEKNSDQKLLIGKMTYITSRRSPYYFFIGIVHVPTIQRL